MFQRLGNVIHGGLATRTKRRVHDHGIVFVDDVVILEPLVDRLSADNAQLRLGQQVG